MKHGTPAPSLRTAARIAGLAYLLIIVTSLPVVILTDTNLVVPGDVAATIDNIMANELVYRIGAAYDLVMFSAVILLSVALFAILKSVNRNLALLALLWRLGEAFAGVITVLASLVTLYLLNGGGHSAALEAGQLEALVGLLLSVRVGGLAILTVFLCLGTIVFCYLFLKSRYIPRALAIWGMLAFMLMLVNTLAGIVMPNFPAVLDTICIGPVALFEFVIGLWLLIKGVDVKQADGLTPESA